MLESSEPFAGKLAARLKRQGLEADDVMLVRDISGLAAAVEAFRNGGEDVPIIVLRARSVADEPLQVGEIYLDQQSHVLRYAGRRWLLRSKPVAVLAALMRNADRVISRESLIKQVWGEFRPEHDATLRVYVHQLRRMLDAGPGAPYPHIATVRIAGRRSGYLFRG
jgi:DNA-binding response OmpR family regulator